MDKSTVSERRKVVARAVLEAKKAMGIDIDALASIQERFDKDYDKLLPQIAREQTEIAEVNAKLHRKALDNRYTEAKKPVVANYDVLAPQTCFCSFLKDFTTPSVCDHDQDVDVEASHQADTDFVCDIASGIARPYAMLRGSEDAINNRVTLVSRMGFNLNDSNFPSTDTYCISPTVLTSGYWLKESWTGCPGDEVPFAGDIQLKLKMTLSQLGGTKVLGEKETTVFDWNSGFTGTIDKTYNVSSSATSENFVLYVTVDPIDGDVFVELTLSIVENITGRGRFLVDMKNSNAFYFWVERVELSRRVCFGAPCNIGGPDRDFHCLAGGPDNVFQCGKGGPDVTVHCVPGGPDVPELCKVGPGLAGCPQGPAVGCLAGPPLDVILDPVLWDRGQVALDLAKVPRSMRRSLSKMFNKILEERQ